MRYLHPGVQPENQLYFECKGGAPHDMSLIKDTKTCKWEVCVRCGEKFRWRKAWKGRIDNPAYLRAHLRNYAQKFGATKRVYNKIYNPEQCRIKL